VIKVFVTIKLAILYQIPIDRVYRAFYILDDVKQQLKAHTDDAVRSTLSMFKVDDLFLSSNPENDASLDILRGLQRKFSLLNTGYDIKDVLIMEISPDVHVRNAMNEINACKRWKEAMAHKAEADKIKMIRMAEAEADTSYLSGVGTAKEREEIVKGMKATLVDVEEERAEQNGDDMGAHYSQDAIDILLVLQYYDTISCIGNNSPSSQNSIILYHKGGMTGEL